MRYATFGPARDRGSQIQKRFDAPPEQRASRLSRLVTLFERRDQDREYEAILGSSRSGLHCNDRQ